MLIKLRNAIKYARRKNEFGKVKNLEIQLVNFNYVNSPNKLKSELKEFKIQIVDKNLHECKQEILRGYADQFEVIGKLSIGDQIRETPIRFGNITDFEHYFNAIDGSYDAEDSIINCYIYKINTPQFKLVNRSQYGKGCDFKHEIIEYRGNNCYIPTKGRFIKCNNYLTGKDYKQQYLDFF